MFSSAAKCRTRRRSQHLTLATRKYHDNSTISNEVSRKISDPYIQTAKEYVYPLEYQTFRGFLFRGKSLQLVVYGGFTRYENAMFRFRPGAC